MNFTIIVPSRGRPKWAEKLVGSIIDTAENLSLIEIIFILDDDDADLLNYRNLKPLNSFVKITLIIQKRSEMHSEDYINKYARLSEAKYIWPLNDDCIIYTKGWDTIICEKAKESKSGIFYGRVSGLNHKINYAGTLEYASGFPLLSKKAVDILGFFFFPQIVGYGAEGNCYWVFAEANAVIELGVRVDHHGGRKIDDETQRTLRKRLPYKITYKEEIQKNAAILREAMK